MKSILVDPRLERTLLQTKSNSCSRKGRERERERRKEGKKAKTWSFFFRGGRVSPSCNLVERNINLKFERCPATGLHGETSSRVWTNVVEATTTNTGQQTRIRSSSVKFSTMGRQRERGREREGIYKEMRGGRKQRVADKRGNHSWPGLFDLQT